MKPHPLLPPLILFIALVAPAHAAKTYCCSDERGKNVCGDVMPNECYGRAYREVGPSGKILRQVDAPLTAEQLAKRDAEAARKKEAEIAAAAEKRKNDALLSAYGNEKDIDFMRDRALADLAAGAKEAQTKYDDAVKRKQKLAAELEFYQKKPVPANLKEQIRVNDVEIKMQQLAIEAKKKEMDQVRAKFDEEKQRFVELKKAGKGSAPRP